LEKKKQKISSGDARGGAGRCPGGGGVPGGWDRGTKKDFQLFFLIWKDG